MGKIKVVHKDTIGKAVFTCAKCGSHVYSAMVVNVGKYAGYGAGYARAIVCVNCQTVQKIVDCNNKDRVDDPNNEPDVSA